MNPYPYKVQVIFQYLSRIIHFYKIVRFVG